MIDMMTLSATRPHSPYILVRPSLPAASADRAARCAVGDYLRDWGVRDPETIASESRRIVQQAAAELVATAGPAMHRDREQQLTEAALQVLLAELDQSMIQSAVATRSDRASVTPAAPPWLELAPPPATAMVVPTAQPREMRPQPRARLWKYLRRGFWAVAARRVRASRGLRRTSGEVSL